MCAPLIFIYTRDSYCSWSFPFCCACNFHLINQRLVMQARYGLDCGSWLSASLCKVWLLNKLKITESKLSSLLVSLFRNVCALLRFYLYPWLLVVVIFLSVAMAVLTLLRSNRWVHHVSLYVQCLPPQELKITESNLSSTAGHSTCLCSVDIPVIITASAHFSWLRPLFWPC